MHTKKGYLVSIGALPPGSENKRGRLSVAHQQLIEKAVAEGIQIQGYSVAPTPTAPAPVVKKATVSTEKQILEPAPYHYPENEYRAYELVDGKRKYRSLREACRHCRLSLVGCWCATPEIVSTDGTKSVRIYIERKEVIANR